MRRECFHCGKEYEVPADGLGQYYTCEGCGKKFFAPKANTTICWDCGSRISTHALSCPHCGRHRLYKQWVFLTILMIIGVFAAFVLPILVALKNM